MSEKYKPGIYSSEDYKWPNDLSRIDKQAIMEEMKKLEYDKKLRKLQDMEHILRAYPGSVPSSGAAEQLTKSKPNSKDRIRERLSQQLTRYEKEIDSLKQSLVKLDSIKYEVGMAVFHRTMGNVIITNIHIVDESNAHYADPVKADFTDGYVYEVIGLEGRVCVRENELMPITDITSNLYGK